MEGITFEHRGQLVIKRIAGGFIIIVTVLMVAFDTDPLTLKDWVKAGILFLLGAMQFTRLSGSDISRISSEGGALKILWRGWIREVKIPEAEIEKITLTGKYAIIHSMDKKPVRVDLTLLDKEVRARAFETLIGYAREKNIELEK